ncbi:MAG: hypothetical protein ACJ75K_14660 [Actinomycetes bacterium]
MAVIVVCIALVLAGLVGVVRWSRLAVAPPAVPEPDTAGQTRRPPALVLRCYLWYLTVAVTAGLGAGILAAGAGGRLVMRLLAVTAGADAQGRITEAEQLVGRITVDGTLGFVVFTGLFFGLASGLVYLLVHRWLPAGRVGGLAYGVLLLVVAGTRLEPLRRDNPDFDLVGPGWLSVAAFATLVVFHGLLVAALAGRLSRAVPLLAASPGAIAAHAPLLVLGLLAPLGLVAALVGLVVVGASRIPQVVAAVQSPRLMVVGRSALAVTCLLVIPGFVSTIVNIVGRG